MTSLQPFALRNADGLSKKDQPFQRDLNVRITCPDCDDPSIPLVEEYGSGDLVCSGCGLVLGDRIVDTKSEWRSFADSDGDDPSRVGGPTDPLLASVDALSTVISFKDGNTGVSKALQHAATRIARDNSSSGRNLSSAFQEISDMCDAFSLPRAVSDAAKQLFKRVDEERLLKGKNQNAIIAACIFIACRQARVPRTFREIVSLTKVKKKEISQCFKIIERAFDTGDAVSTSIDSIITRYCNHLGLPISIQTACLHLAPYATDMLSGRSPITIASSCILFITQLFNVRKSAREIAHIAGVQENTIRQATRELIRTKEKLVKPEWFTRPTREGYTASYQYIS